MSKETTIIIIGAGASGIAMGCQLQRKLNFTDFEIYEKDVEFGGTWWVNTYPGCACDILSHFYSFSFEQNPDWSKVFPAQPEIHEYMVKVAEKYNLRAHTHFSTECLGADWDKQTEGWTVHFKNLKTGENFSKTCQFLVLCQGALSVPNDCPVPGLENFKGDAFHSARWNHKVDLTNKDVIVIGNGCSATQFVPVILPKTKTLTQFIRSPHWIFERYNWEYPAAFKWVMKHVPGAMSLYRLFWAVFLDPFFLAFKKEGIGKWWRKRTEKDSREYIMRTAPKKYHELLIPKFEVGAKRRIFDGYYLPCLNCFKHCTQFLSQIMKIFSE